MDKKQVSKITAITVVLMITLCFFTFVLGLITARTKTEKEYYDHLRTVEIEQKNDNKTNGSTAGINAVSLEELKDKFFVPIYMQTDEQWANIPYGKGTIKDIGCGLCCGAMAIQKLTGKTFTPKDLADKSNGAMLSDGINDVDKIVSFIYNSWGAELPMQKRGRFSEIETVHECVTNDWLVFGSCFGVIGDFETSESGHIVLIYDVDQEGFYLRDPYCITNNRRFGFDEFNNIAWAYFWGLKAGV